MGYQIEILQVGDVRSRLPEKPLEIPEKLLGRRNYKNKLSHRDTLYPGNVIHLSRVRRRQIVEIASLQASLIALRVLKLNR